VNSKPLELIKRFFARIFRYLKSLADEYFHFRGNLLARGIAYSILVTIVPTLFLALYIGSLIFTRSPELQTSIQVYISSFLPITYSEEVMGMVHGFMSDGSWKNMGIVGIIMLFVTPSFLFASIERALSVVMRPPVKKNFAHRQGVYFLIPIVIMVLLFGVAFVSGWAHRLESLLNIPASVLFWTSKLPTIIIMALSLSAIYRLSYHHTINLKVLFPVSFGLAMIWQIFSSSASAIVAVTGKNQVMYGMMAGAMVLLLLAYIFSVLLITGGVIIGRESDKEKHLERK